VNGGFLSTDQPSKEPVHLETGRTDGTNSARVGASSFGIERNMSKNGVLGIAVMSGRST
jgi:hypothetical protein